MIKSINEFKQKQKKLIKVTNGHQNFKVNKLKASGSCPYCRIYPSRIHDYVDRSIGRDRYRIHLDHDHRIVDHIFGPARSVRSLDDQNQTIPLDRIDVLVGHNDDRRICGFAKERERK